eukprot:11124476-Alexandrium_andersonii.AAC.1
MAAGITPSVPGLAAHVHGPAARRATPASLQGGERVDHDRVVPRPGVLCRAGRRAGRGEGSRW